MNKLSIGDVWVQSAAFLRAEGRLVAPIALALLAIPGALLMMIMPPDSKGAPTTMADQPPPGPWLLGALLLLGVMLVGQLAISRLAIGWDGSVGSALKLSARRFLTLLGANMLLVVIVFVPLLIVLTLFSLGGKAGEALGWVVIAIPLLMVFIRASLSLPIAVNETDGPLATLRRSFAISRGSSWRLLGFAAVFAMGAVVLAGAVSAVTGLVLVALVGAPEPWSVALALMALVAGVAQAAILSVWTVMLSRIYLSLTSGSAVRT